MSLNRQSERPAGSERNKRLRRENSELKAELAVSDRRAPHTLPGRAIGRGCELVGAVPMRVAAYERGIERVVEVGRLRGQRLHVIRSVGRCRSAAAYHGSTRRTSHGCPEAEGVGW
jgi:hypothetical protein